MTINNTNLRVTVTKFCNNNDNNYGNSSITRQIRQTLNLNKKINITIFKDKHLHLEIMA